MLLPIGGHKGAGLALMIGLLAGVLNGAAFGRDVVDFMGPGTEPTNTGQFVIALDVAAVYRAGAICRRDGAAHAASCARRRPCRASTRSGFRARSASAALDRSANGVQLPAALIKQLDELAAGLSIKPLSARVG